MSISINDWEAVLSDVAEALDVDERALSRPAPLKLPKRIPETISPDNIIEKVDDLDIVETSNGDTRFWIFLSLEDAKVVNDTYSKWLIETDKTELTSSPEVVAHAINHDLLTQFVFSVAYGSEAVEILAYGRGPEAFWKTAATYDLFPDATEDATLDWVPDKYINKFRTAYARAATKNPLQFLFDSVGKKETSDLLLNSIGIDGNAAERLATYIVNENSLKPLNLAKMVGTTRHGLVFLQISGKPVTWSDLDEIPQPL